MQNHYHRNPYTKVKSTGKASPSPSPYLDNLMMASNNSMEHQVYNERAVFSIALALSLGLNRGQLERDIKGNCIKLTEMKGLLFTSKY